MISNLFLLKTEYFFVEAIDLRLQNATSRLKEISYYLTINYLV